MTRAWLVAAVMMVVVAACGGEEHEDLIDSTGVHGAATDYAMAQGQARSSDLVYVVGPSIDIWDTYCGAGFAEGIDAVCAVLDSTAFDLSETFQDPRVTEIASALAPRAVGFITDPETVLEAKEGEFVTSVNDGAGLLTFGVTIQANGRVFLPLDGQGEGWLFEATPTEDRWILEPIAMWIV